MENSVSLCPFYLARIPLHLEVLVALGAAEAKHLGVVAYEANTMARIHGARAKPALFEAHCAMRSQAKRPD